jgi:hypothetical protein
MSSLFRCLRDSSSLRTRNTHHAESQFQLARVSNPGSLFSSHFLHEINHSFFAISARISFDPALASPH